MEITWKYRCSACDKLVHPDDMKAHIEQHKADPEWRGVMHLTRVDDDEENDR